MTALGQTVTCLRDLKLPAGGARGARRFVDPCCNMHPGSLVYLEHKLKIKDLVDQITYT